MVSCLGSTDHHFKNCLLSSCSVTPPRLSVWEKRVWEIQPGTENHEVRAFFLGFPFIPTQPAQCNFLSFVSSCSFTLWKSHTCKALCQSLDKCCLFVRKQLLWCANINNHFKKQIIHYPHLKWYFLWKKTSALGTIIIQWLNILSFCEILASCFVFYWKRHNRTVLVTVFDYISIGLKYPKSSWDRCCNSYIFTCEVNIPSKSNHIPVF